MTKKFEMMISMDLNFYLQGTSQYCGFLSACFGNINFLVNKQVGYKNDRILILDVNLDEIRYVLVNPMKNMKNIQKKIV